ncbi:hypothetical protein ACMU_06365 [Actibacterium mucosum KCTC 23349]|uniref:Glycosyl transferase family 92 n=1 Tax=Actibacterium mucosum KCTC 23349 TaxID=1454373 RepID=A0A037ZLZ1_9RHOB|nr:glycosyltransferase family 2 protein [Actibacterium mucosum]KAJ56562.1 hypothetical protein ACMU_06365 [Actibacterium mucosum KCTC 23349]
MLRALFSGKPVTKLRFDPPVAAPDRAGLALILIVRNEARHIGEWAAFHLVAGVGHVYAYDNGCTDGTMDILRAELGEALTVIPWDQKLFDGQSGRELHNQVLAYAHAIRNFGARWRWMAAIDADEFLVPVADASLADALAPLADVRSITLPWHNFGRNGHDAIPEGGVVRNYTTRAADPASGARGVSNFKTIVDPCHVTALRVHSYEIDGKPVTWNDRGEAATNKGRSERQFYAATRIQLNHYYARSNAELEAKIARGSNRSVEAAKHAARVRRNVANIEAEVVEDLLALDFLARVGQSPR